MDSDEDLPVVLVREGIEYTEDERLLVDGMPLPPGRYRLQLPDDGQMPVLSVAGDDDLPTVINVSDVIG